MFALALAAMSLALQKPHIAVFGATGGVGSESAYQALERGAKVSVLCRSPSKLVVPPGSGGAAAGSKLASDRLRVVQGDVTSASDVSSVFEGADEPITGCVVALGGKTSEVGKTMLTDGTTNIINSMKSNDVKRVSVVTSIGAGDSFDQAPFAFKLFMWTVLKDAFVDKNEQEALFLSGNGKDLEWTVVRPGGLTLGPPTGTTKVITGTAGSISRADVANFCLDAVMDDSWGYLSQTPCISAGMSD
mmetsp:Transcript_8057/g.22210  ORF Transcript_8057/g.22210 Transcript_8057/m.22210 type:complete len:246 (-) Transcript_8057:284-1021(-)